MMTLARLPQAFEEHPHTSAEASRASEKDDEEPQTRTVRPLRTGVSQRRKNHYSNTLLRRLGLVYTKTGGESTGPLETTCKWLC